MSIRNLEQLLQPRSVAVIGASSRRHSVGATVLRNILRGGFAGPIYPINPKYQRIAGLPAYPDIDALPAAPALAVICTPPGTVPGLIAQLGQRGTRAAIVLTAGLSALTDSQGRTLTQAMLAAAKPHLLRILGPNCVGLLVPGIKLNASFAHVQALPGKLAFVSQSGAMVTAVLDWANARGIGFSHFISVGERADVDLADLIDYLGSDAGTRAILLYVESIKAARKFMSAARAAARNKPLIVVKAGRAPEGVKAARSHTGALAGSDDVFDAAIRRAGMLRVDTLLDLFSAAETLSHVTRFAGERLAIMTNGGGAGVMAADALALAGGKLAEISAETMARLDAALPATWSRGNPVDIIGDAPVERYTTTLGLLCADPQVDAILFMHAPTAIVPSAEIAAACASAAKASPRLVMSCWLGDSAVAKARRVFHAAGIPDYETPEEAVGAFLQLVAYRKNQEALLELVPEPVNRTTPDLDQARALVATALAQGRELLTEIEAKSVLGAFAIPTVATYRAADIDGAVRAAASIGYPVALKIDSPDISHKSDVGGVALDLADADELGAAAKAMLKRIAAMRPNARIEGFSVQSMVRRAGAHELILGATVDPLFGPAILFGQGGTSVEVVGDRAVGLPPLTAALAHDLVGRTRVAKLLAGYRDRPRANHDAIYSVLERLSELVIALPEVIEVDINPLLADADGVVALDARMRVAQTTDKGAERLAIRPYPSELEERFDWAGQQIVLRPIRPADWAQHLRFLERLDPEDVRMRVFHSKRHIAPSELARLTLIDYEREMAFIATLASAHASEETLGVIRTVTDPENVTAEFALIVRSDLKGRGLGSALFDKMRDYCARRGTRTLVGDVLRENRSMLRFVRRLGFTEHPSSDPSVVRVSLALGPEGNPVKPE